MTIQETVNRMMEDFINNSSGLLNLSQNTKEIIHHREGGNMVYYGKFFAKPTKRFSRLLTVDREILIIFSNFQDQQVRTISKAREIINSSNGRLEPTVSIVVHCDRYANLKLKKWGRQKGISVLPIYYEEQDFPREDELEKQLCNELFSHDPFDISGPVSDDSQFYGRRSEALDMARKLNSGQIRSYLGIRKIGKTSILNRIITDANQHYGTKSVVIDCSKDQIWSMTASQLMYIISQNVENLVSSDKPYTYVMQVTKSNIDISDSTESLLESIRKCNETVVLFFDEIDYITPGSPTGKHWLDEFNIFWRNLRAVYQEICRQDNNLGLFISGVSSKWFCIEAIQGIENAALSFIPEEYLSPMPRGASEQMIKVLARTSGLQFENSEEIISEFCSDIPFWVRKACSYIHRNIDIADRPLKINNASVRILLNEFLEKEGGVLARVAIMHLFKVYPELQDIAVKCYNNEGDTCSRVYLNRLERYGVIVTKPVIQISGSMMREGIRLFIDHINEISDYSDTVISTTNDRISFETYDEWADELAIINKDRNILEKKLRGIVINFIRADYLSNRSKGIVTDRILKIVPSDQKDKYRNLSPEEILEKFLWSDLSKIIEKEWLVFEKIFNDKNSFTLNSTVINGRLDAHAKNADKIDIAAYRNAIYWMEEKIRLVS